MPQVVWEERASCSDYAWHAVFAAQRSFAARFPRDTTTPGGRTVPIVTAVRVITITTVQRMTKRSRPNSDARTVGTRWKRVLIALVAAPIAGWCAGQATSLGDGVSRTSTPSGIALPLKRKLDESATKPLIEPIRAATKTPNAFSHLSLGERSGSQARERAMRLATTSETATTENLSRPRPRETSPATGRGELLLPGEPSVKPEYVWTRTPHAMHLATTSETSASETLSRPLPRPTSPASGRGDLGEFPGPILAHDETLASGPADSCTPIVTNIPPAISAGPWMNQLDPYIARADELPDYSTMNGGVPIPTVTAPLDVSVWWQNAIAQPMGLSPHSLPIDVATVTQTALVSSPFVKGILSEPLIRQNDVVIADADFDTLAFIEAKFANTNEPVGSALTTGDNSDRFRDETFSSSAGVRKKTRAGGSFEIVQRGGFQDNNSTFLVPNPQGTSRLEFNFTQPLLRDHGRTVNQTRVLLAQIDMQVATSEVRDKLEDHLVNVTRAYWELFQARAEWLQRNRLVESATKLSEILQAREGIDSHQRQVLRAQAAVASRRSDLVRVETRVRNAQAQLRVLTGDPRLVQSSLLELTPQDMPLAYPISVSTRQATITALDNRNDIAAAIREIQAVSARVGAARNQVLPRLDLILGTYVAGLDGKTDTFGAIGNQFSDGGASYAAGLLFEIPVGNRANRARLARNQWEMQRALYEFQQSTEVAFAEVEVAVRETRTTFNEMATKKQSIDASENEVNYLRQRWELLPDPNESPVLLIEDLLDAQERLADEERAFVRAQVAYALSWVSLRKVTGVLLRMDQQVSAPAGDVELSSTGQADWPNTSNASAPTKSPLPAAPASDLPRYAVEVTDEGAEVSGHGSMIALQKLLPKANSGKIDSSAADRTAVARLKRERISDDESIRRIVRKSQALALSLDAIADQAIGQHTDRLRSHVATSGQSIDADLLVLAAAGVIAAIKRTLGLSLFDVQLFAGVIVSRGGVAEMQTGEGKTLSGILPAYVHALAGRGVHVATTNRYLATRDQQQLAPVFDLLGVTTGLVTEDSTDDQARHAYDADITFAPGHVFGFDFLKDQLTLSRSSNGKLGSEIYRRINTPTQSSRANQRELRGRGLHCAIVDEIDNVLIDDAVSPLVLSQASTDEAPDQEVHRRANALAKTLQDDDYRLDRLRSEVSFTEIGYQKIYDDREMATHSQLVRPWHEYVALAIRANECLRQDVDYVVRADKVQIVDASTGRIFSDRTWSSGLHQAVLANHQLPITPESTTLARITRQRFFRHYKNLAGMTGTAIGCEREFESVYGLPVVQVPLRAVSKRIRLPDQWCDTEDEKWDAIVTETQRMHAEGRAVLIGTHSIEQSLAVSRRLKERGLSFELLNGIQDEDEAAIIAKAGAAGAITVATNLAGRGTDIKLDPLVARCGGLHVIIAQRHGLARVDRQLTGRCARCGDPGSARAFVAADEPLVREHAPWIERAMSRGINREATETLIAKSFSKIQANLERQAAHSRWRLLQFDRDTESLLRRAAKQNDTPSGCWQL